MSERRKYRRFKSELVITTVYRNENGKIVTDESIVSEDIGIGGLRIKFPRKIPKGKVIDLKVFLFSDPIHLPAKGQVVWSSEKQKLELSTRNGEDKSQEELFWIGVQFVDIDNFHRERVLRWIKKEFKVRDF